MSSPGLTLGPPSFLITKEYRRFVEFCEACRRYRYIGLCYGPPGVGKTLSARHYARWELVEAVDAHRYDDGFSIPPEVEACRTVVYAPSVTVIPKQLGIEVEALSRQLNWLIDDLRHPNESNVRLDGQTPWIELLIVDEADRLKMASLEVLRDRYDRSGVGLILIGMPGLEKRLARYAQFYSRVGFVHEFRPLSPEEMGFVLACGWQQLGLILEPNDPTDAEAMAAIIRITRGNFRLIQRLFSQIERILQINELKRVTKQVVETARESLVIGPL
jgi:DNA transposition AAA+ family ATPase